jgi:hypothetical protein
MSFDSFNKVALLWPLRTMLIAQLNHYWYSKRWQRDVEKHSTCTLAFRLNRTDFWIILYFQKCPFGYRIRTGDFFPFGLDGRFIGSARFSRGSI